MKKRLTDIDFYKGIAILLVVFYHLLVDLYMFRLTNINPFDVPWIIMARIVASTFIFLSGAMFSVSYILRRQKFISRVLLRSMKLLILGLVITFSFYSFYGEWNLLFGILHFLAIAPLCTLPLLKYKRTLPIIAILIFILTPFVSSLNVNHLWFLIIGVVPKESSFLDYFPLCPWLGIYLFGTFSGLTLYRADKISLFGHIPTDNLFNRLLTWMGRYTLTIYLLHQPVFLLIINLFL